MPPIPPMHKYVYFHFTAVLGSVCVCPTLSFSWNTDTISIRSLVVFFSYYLV